MNKPKWEDAPEWAEYLAMDGNGTWWWYEMEPYLIYKSVDYPYFSSLGKAKEALLNETHLEKRP